MNLVFYNPKLDKVPKNILTDILELNQDNKPALGGIDGLIHLEKLYNSSMFCLCNFFEDKLNSFALIMSKDSDYQSPNFLYFKNKYKDFIYIDRIAVQSNFQRKGIGTSFYKSIYQLNRQNNIPLCCEVNTFPLNQQSLDFHIKNKFKIIEEVDFGKKRVVMLVKSF